jgi:hypothetical protein
MSQHSEVTAGHLLRSSLELAVPMYISELRDMDPEQRLKLGREAADYIAHHGDDLLYRGGRKGDSAKAFNATARGIAALAFAPGGVTVFGLHFEAER